MSNTCCSTACCVRPRSCKPPCHLYSRCLNQPFESKSVYCMSYPGCCAKPPPPARKCFSGPKTMCHPLEGCTVTAMSFRPPGGGPACPVRPRRRDVIAHCNPCRWLITTQRHDYPPKQPCPRAPRRVQATRSCLPMDLCTVARSSYTPVCACIPKSHNKRWAEVPPAARPPLASSCETVHRQSYKGHGGGSACSLGPPQCVGHSCMPLECATTYRKSYTRPCCACCPC